MAETNTFQNDDEEKPFEPTHPAGSVKPGEQFSLVEWGDTFIRINNFCVKKFKMDEKLIWACSVFTGNIRGFKPDRIVHKREVSDTIRRDVVNALIQAFPSLEERHQEDEHYRLYEEDK